MTCFLFGVSTGEALSGNTDAALVFVVLGLLWFALDRTVSA
jgi:hypothetical protein